MLFSISNLHISHAQRIKVLTLASNCVHSVGPLPCSGPGRGITSSGLRWLQVRVIGVSFRLRASIRRALIGSDDGFISCIQNAATYPRIALRVFREEIAIIAPFTWLWTSNGLERVFQWALKGIVGLLGSAYVIRLVRRQMSFRCFLDMLQMMV